MTCYRSVALLTTGLLFAVAQATAQNATPVKIVGIGATSCARFTTEITANADAEKNYLAWMQGYMSGIMVGRPAGVDEGIDLTPYTFPLVAQAEFMRAFCATFSSNSKGMGIRESSIVSRGSGLNALSSSKGMKIGLRCVVESAGCQVRRRHEAARNGGEMLVRTCRWIRGGI